MFFDIGKFKSSGIGWRINFNLTLKNPSSYYTSQGKFLENPCVFIEMEGSSQIYKIDTSKPHPNRSLKGIDGRPNRTEPR